jgi:hypothetical protein
MSYTPKQIAQLIARSYAMPIKASESHPPKHEWELLIDTNAGIIENALAEREAQVRAEEREKAKVLVEALSYSYRLNLINVYNSRWHTLKDDAWHHNNNTYEGKELVEMLGVKIKDMYGYYDANEILDGIESAVHPAITEYNDKIKGE